jgi:hypothetical protein
MRNATGASAFFAEDQIIYAPANSRYEENVALKSDLF